MAPIRLPILALSLSLSLAPLAHATCYVAAFGLIGALEDWAACPGTAASAGGVESCCMSTQDCGEDGICRIPASENPGDNEWYQSGCTDKSFDDALCRNTCGMLF